MACSLHLGHRRPVSRPSYTATPAWGWMQGQLAPGIVGGGVSAKSFLLSEPGIFLLLVLELLAGSLG